MTPSIRIAVVCFAVAILILNKPLARMTAAWQRMIGLGVAANETTNRVCYVIGGLLFLILGTWAT
jgi:low affinity Fe/Cu permease